MNPLTLVKRIQQINTKEAALGISEGASWHAKYKESAYVFVGGIPFDLTEGDLLAVFAQYGEIVDVNLVRDKGTGKSKGFAFIAYEDQRSTNLAVDNLNGAQVLGRIIRVDHVSNYKKKEEEDEETERQKREARGVCRAFQRGDCNRGAGCKFSHDEQRAANTGWGPEEDEETERQKREARGVCRAFQRGDCNRGAGCKFSHDEQRAANTGWGPEDKSLRWGHNKFEGSTKGEKRFGNISSNRVPEPTVQEGFRSGDKDAKSRHKRSEVNTRDQDSRGLEKQSERKEKEMNHEEDRDRRATEKRSARREFEPNPREDHDRREEKRTRRHESDRDLKEDRGKWEEDRSSAQNRDSSSYRHRERDEDYPHKSRR